MLYALTTLEIYKCEHLRGKVLLDVSHLRLNVLRTFTLSRKIYNTTVNGGAYDF
jgi:hypothetical protein